MWKTFKKHLQHRQWHKQWTNRKIAFVSILIATSVAFILIFSNIMPIVSLPSFKLMAGGLPVKLTGYIFGPVIGGVTGAISDIISFSMRPTYFHFYYTMAWVMAGFIPGVIGYFFNRRWKPRKEMDKLFNTQKNLPNFFVTLFILLIIMIGVFVMVWNAPDATFEEGLLKDRKLIFLAISLFGISSMFLALIIFWFFLKAKTFNAILPIISFSALLEICATPLITLGDMATLADGESGSFITLFAGHMLLSPLKIWGNMIIILISYRIISPLIYSKQNNGWD